jgi:hypothetical protein
MRKTLVSRFRVLVLVIAVVGLLVAACGDDDEGVATDSTSTSEPDVTSTSGPDPTTTPAPTTEPAITSTAAPEPTTTPPPTTTPVPELEVVRVYWLRDTGIAVGGREVPIPSLAGSALGALLEGPNTLESELGMVSAVPPGTEVLGLAIEDGVATIDLSSEFEATGLGTTGRSGGEQL